MKGTDKLRSKLPDYQGIHLLLYVVLAFLIFIVSLLFQLFLDSIPRIFRNIEILQTIAPLTPFIGPLIVTSIGFLIVRRFWKIKDKYLIKYEEKAYQKAFKLVPLGIPLLFSVIIHSFFPTDLIAPYRINDGVSRILGDTITELILFLPSYILYVRLALSILLTGLGLVVVNRTLAFFGIDYMALVYIFYPEESTLQNHEIYSVLRHPTYHALLMLSIGSIFFRLSIYSVTNFLFFLVGINLHIRYIEEKELIERFGDEYRKYKEIVPAFFVKFKDLKKYFSLLMNFKTSSTKHARV